MLILKLKTRNTVAERSFALKFPDGSEGIIQLLDCSRSGAVRIGIEMPEDVQILRGTLLEKIRALEAAGLVAGTDSAPCPAPSVA